MKRALPTDSAERKNYPLFRGFLRYFPAAIAGAARISHLGNIKHNPGEEMHHARGKSMDHGDCVMRHLHDADEIIAEYERSPKTTQDWANVQAVLDEVDQLFWRAGALSQEIHEKYGNAPLAMGARLPEKEIRNKIEVDADGGAVAWSCNCNGTIFHAAGCPAGQR